MKYSIEIVVSTNDQNINKIISNFDKLSFCKVLIIQQTKNHIEKVFNHKNINIISFQEIGLSKSRNKGLEHCSGDIIVIADDDLQYVSNFHSILEDSFHKYPEADIITFQIITPENIPYKTYKNKVFFHNIFSINKVSSVEIAFRKKKVVNTINFDEKFGLGSKYPLGEETIFLSDALNRGLKILYVPIPIVIHPAESTGIRYTENNIMARGAVLMRIYGSYAYIINIAFALKKYQSYKNSISLLKYMRLIFKGTSDYKRMVATKSD